MSSGFMKHPENQQKKNTIQKENRPELNVSYSYKKN